MLAPLDGEQTVYFVSGGCDCFLRTPSSLHAKQPEHRQRDDGEESMPPDEGSSIGSQFELPIPM